MLRHLRKGFHGHALFERRFSNPDGSPEPRRSRGMTDASLVVPPATIRVRRAGGSVGGSPLSRSWTILIDGQAEGSISPGETVDLSPDTGPHTIQLLSRGFLRSAEVAFRAEPGRIGGYFARPRARHPFLVQRTLAMLVASIFNHDVWISLAPEEVDESAMSGPDALERSTLRSSGGAGAGWAGARRPSGSLSTGEYLAQIPLSPRRDGAEHDAALVVRGLTKQFGARTAFSDVSFEVDYGEVFGFLGPNGAGKTTTVRTLGTLIAPTSGSAIVAGIPLSAENGVEIRQRISIMPESPGLYLRLTVTENLEYFAGLYGLKSSGPRIHDALDAVNLVDRANDPCGGLSKGLRQRVGLARTLLSDPKIMFLDEPTSGLDPVAALEVHNLIIGLRGRGVTIFLTTHRLDEAEKLCDRVAILNTTLRTVGRPSELRERLFRSALVVRTIKPLADPEGLFGSVAGVESWHEEEPASYLLTVTDPRAAAPEVTRTLVGVGADVLSIGEAQHSLEDVYLELIDEDVEARH
jgi:ABC-2 type transport system ATP-binding protein